MNKREQRSRAALQAKIDAELKEWIIKDARRCGMTLAQYIEQLLQARKERAPQFEKLN